MVAPLSPRLARKYFWEVCAVGMAKLPLRSDSLKAWLPRMRLGRSLALPIRQIHNLVSRGLSPFRCPGLRWQLYLEAMTWNAKFTKLPGRLTPSLFCNH